MRQLILALLFVFSTQTFAARFEIIEGAKLENVKLQELSKFWSEGPGKYTDVFAQSAVIISKRPSEPYENTLMQMLWGSYTFSVSADATRFERTILKKEIDFLFDASSWLQNEAEPSQIRAFKKELLQRLLELSKNSEIFLFVGVIEGDFSSSFVHLSLVDTKNQQTLSLVGGYAE